tara:strand:+ start:848 stop:1261 length:414 start_codon:yes stop_codon:yes gene_type:complete
MRDEEWRIMNKINTNTAGYIIDLIKDDVFHSEYFEDVCIYPENVEHAEFKTGVNFVLTINNRSMLYTISHNWLDYFDIDVITIPNMIDRHEIKELSHTNMTHNELENIIDGTINRLLSKTKFMELLKNIENVTTEEE